MSATPASYMVRVIPDRSNRALWWLTAGVSYPLLFVGPIAAAVVYNAIYSTSLISILAWLWLLNGVIMTAALIVGAFALRRARQPLDGRRAVLFAVGLTAGAAVVRFIVIRLSYPFGFTPVDGVDTPYFFVQLALGIVLVASVSSAILYASSRERALDEAFVELNRAQVSLAQEEEQVRADVFDQLHGSLQSQFVAMRQALVDLASTSSDPHTVKVASEVEQGLERTYREGVQTLTRTLIPSGLEAGLGIALAELDTRLGGAMEIEIRMDPVISTMDNPMTGGIHRDVRLAGYRIVEEAAANAMEHSGARRVVVDVTSRLQNGAAMLDLEVAHGVAEPVTVSEGSGLARMRARARALGGTAGYGCEDSRFVVRASLPLARPDGGRWSVDEF